jgi:P27 family predicted phage terminase small subunit
MGGPGSGRKPQQGNGTVAVPARPGAVAVIPRRPVGLGDRGRREWPRIWAAGSGWLNAEQDYPWVEQVARAWDDIAAYRKRIRADGLVQTGSQGQPVAHPLITEVRRCEDTIRKCLSEIGFSPAARHRLALAQVRTASKLDELAAKRAERAAQQLAAAAAAVVEAEVISDSVDGEW